MTIDMNAPRVNAPTGIGYFVNALSRPKAAFAALPQQPRWVWWVLFVVIAILTFVPPTLSDQRKQANANPFNNAQRAQQGQQAARPQTQGQGQQGGIPNFGGGQGGQQGAPNAGGNNAANRAPNNNNRAGAQAAPTGALGSLSQLGSLSLPSVIPTQVLPILTALAGLGGQVLWWSLWSLALMLGSAIGGGRATFGPLFKLMLTASLPLALRGIGQGLYLLLGASTDTIGQAGLSGLIALTADNSTAFMTAFLRALLAYVDVFQLWHLALIVVGMVVLARLRVHQAIATVAVIVLLFALFTAVPMLMSGALA